MKAHAGMIAMIALVWSLICGLSWAGETALVWSTFLGGSDNDNGYDIALDDFGNVCITGFTKSFDFPTTAGSFDPTHNGDDDVFVAKLNSEGNALIYSTLIGGSGLDGGYSISVDDGGNAYVTGVTKSANFPTTALAFDTTHNGTGWLDAFAVKLNPAGSALEYSTFLGGAWGDFSYAIDVNDNGHAYVTGNSYSSDFPTTVLSFDSTHNGEGDVFITKLNSTGSTLEYSTFLGGSGTEVGKSIEVDESGYAYLTGSTASEDFPFTSGAFDTTYNGGSEDAFVAKINPTGSALDYCTFLGGCGFDRSVDMALNDKGEVYATGYTYSFNFPTTMEAFDPTPNGGEDIFVAKLNLTGSALEYATFLGGSDHDKGKGIAVDNSGYAYLTGGTSGNFPTSAVIQDNMKDYYGNAYVAKLDPCGKHLEYSAILGGSSYELGCDIVVDDAENAYLIGHTQSPDFPITLGAFDITFGGSWEAFVVKLDLSGYPVSVVSEVPLVILPESCALHQNYPNPFNVSTEIRYRIPQDGDVNLRVFNSLGQEVRILVNAEQKAGEHLASWDGRDAAGNKVASGVYFCRLEAGAHSKTVKMVHLM